MDPNSRPVGMSEQDAIREIMEHLKKNSDISFPFNKIYEERLKRLKKEVEAEIDSNQIYIERTKTP